MAAIGSSRHSHVGLWITLTIIFLIIVLPIGLVFAFFFDPTHTTSEQLGVNTTGTGQKKSLADSLVTDMFDYTDDASKNNSLSISIGETEINQMLFDNLLSVMDTNTKSFVPQAYVEIQEDKYVFVVELNAYGFFKTRLFLETALTLSDNPKGLMFELKNIKVGRLGGIQNIAFSLIGNNVTDAQLNQIFKDSFPLSIESHIFDGGEKRYLFYPHESFVKDLNGMMNFGEDGAFFSDFIIDMVSNRKFTFDFYNNKSISGLMSLQQFHDNADYCSYNDYVIDFEAKKEISKYLPTLLKNGNIDGTNIDTFTKFISYGYSQLNDTETNTIKDASFLPAALGKTLDEYSSERAAKFATKGAALADVVPVDQLVYDQVEEALTPTRVAEIIANNGGEVVDASVSEVQLHDVLKSNEMIGYGKTFYSVNADGSYKVSFISVDNLYINIIDGNLYFIVGININGYEVSMILSTNVQTGSNGKIYFKLNPNGAYMGTYKLPATLFESFSQLLSQSVGNSGWFSYDSVNKRFAVDFADAVNSNPQIKFLKTSGLDIEISISANGENIVDNGHLGISVSASRS